MAFMKKVEKVQSMEEAREKFIMGGGLVAEDVKKEKEEWSKVLMRIRSDVLRKIDKLVEKRMGLTRTAWLLEAIQEKLVRYEEEEKRSP